MKFQPARLAVLLALILLGCSDGGKISSHPSVTQAQLEKDAESSLPRETLAGSDMAYEKGEIQVLESSYSGDNATIVLVVGSVRVGSLVSANVELETERRPKMASTDTLPWKLRVDYEWLRGEWKLRRLDNLTFEKK